MNRLQFSRRRFLVLWLASLGSFAATVLARAQDVTPGMKRLQVRRDDRTDRLQKRDDKWVARRDDPIGIRGPQRREDRRDLRTILFATLTLLAWTGVANAADNMKAFPAPEKGRTRYVLALPKEENEANLKIEVVIGKTVRVDLDNKYFFGGKLESRTAQGWGFTYYVLANLGPMAGTLMAVDPNLPKVDRFVPLAGEPLLLRYNSKLPVVIYVPEGVEVRYRVWRAPTETIKVSPG